MAHTFEYKGHPVTVWPKQVGNKWDWEVKAGDLPTRRNDDDFAPTREVAIEEASALAKRLLDQLPPLK